MKARFISSVCSLCPSPTLSSMPNISISSWYSSTAGSGEALAAFGGSSYVRALDRPTSINTLDMPVSAGVWVFFY